MADVSSDIDRSGKYRIWAIATDDSVWYSDVTCAKNQVYSVDPLCSSMSHEPWNYNGATLSHLSVSANGLQLWGVQSGGDVWYLGDGLSGSTWTQVPAPSGITTISVSGDGSTVWATTSSGQIYQRPGDLTSDWVAIPGYLTDVKVAGDGSTVYGIGGGYAVYYRGCAYPGKK